MGRAIGKQARRWPRPARANEGTSALGETSRSAVTPGLFVIAAFGIVPEVPRSNPSWLGSSAMIKARMAETGTGAANINTRSGPTHAAQVAVAPK